MSIRPHIDPAERRAIAGWRERLLMTQDDLARAVGVSRNTVASWERARRMPRIPMRRAIAEVFAERGVSVDQIIWPEKEATETSEQRQAS